MKLEGEIKRKIYGDTKDGIVYSFDYDFLLQNIKMKVKQFHFLKGECGGIDAGLKFYSLKLEGVEEFNCYFKDDPWYNIKLKDIKFEEIGDKYKVTMNFWNSPIEVICQNVKYKVLTEYEL